MRSGSKGMAGLRIWPRTAALAVVLASGVAHGAGGVCERIVITGNPDYPPLLWVNPDDPGRLVGAAVELLEKALEPAGRSEERRVGKECRSRWALDHRRTRD